MKINYKKIVGYIILIFLAMFIFTPSVFAEYTNYEAICTDEKILNAMQILGYVIQVIKWIAPLIIIVLGMIDFGKAAISNDEKAINKATTALIRRLIAGIVIFFIPTIILAVLKYVPTGNIEDKNHSQFGACTKCLFDPDNSCGKKKNNN